MDTIPTDVKELAEDLNSHLSESLKTLDQRLSRVEEELDLESANLRELVGSRSPEISSQFEALSKTIKDLHLSLAEVRGHLHTASDEAEQLKSAASPALVSSKTSETNNDDEPEISAQEAATVRHDEKITLGGILRALLMADEPGQREKKW